jgi:hypothetical protein
MVEQRPRQSQTKRSGHRAIENLLEEQIVSFSRLTQPIADMGECDPGGEFVGSGPLPHPEG